MTRRLAVTLAPVVLSALAACSTVSKPAVPVAHQDAQAPELPKLDAEVAELAVQPPVSPKGSRLDHSGRKQTGRASYYHHRFANRKMADGNRFDPNTDVAASKSLPLGTTAKVTNVENGKSATVKVEDRGPYVDGRVVDLAPKVADELDIRKQGVAPVIVAPIAVPQPDGAIKLGAGAAEASPQEIEQATRDAGVVPR
jgi:rare lipoprotein A